MKASQVIEVHNLLHRGEVGKEILDASRHFSKLTFKELSFVTQNMAKHSHNTDWINQDPENRRITWVFKNNLYHGKVKEFKDAETGKIIVEVHSLNPDRLIYRTEDGIVNKDLNDFSGDN